uniref:TolC family outer membrane protein n=1 Tax=Halomonas sp. TaxID=1486246 RepID=UPI0026103C43|nr:TolC family outer membrane protein [Halomonas sp.]
MKKTLFYFFSTLSLSSSFCIHAYAAEPLNGQSVAMPAMGLQEVVLRAFETDPAVVTAAADLGISTGEVEEARSAWRPQVGFQAGAGGAADDDSDFDQTRTYGLTLSQLVYDFGRTDSTIDQKLALSHGKQYGLQMAVNSVAARAIQAYLNVKRYEELKRVAEEGVSSLQKVKGIATLRVEGGLSTKSDELQTDARIASMLSQIADYDAQIAAAKAQLSVLTGVQVQALAEYPNDLKDIKTNLDSIDYSVIPEVQQVESQAEASEKGVDIAKTERLPSFRVEGQRIRYDTDDAYWDTSIQLKMDAPIYQGGAVSARVRQAESQVKMSESQVNQARQDVLLAASTANSTLQGTRERTVAAQRQLQSSLKSRDVYRDEYLLGNRSVNDLLSTEQEVYQAKVAVKTAMYDQWKAVIDYRTAIHQLLPALRVQARSDLLPDI